MKTSLRFVAAICMAASLAACGGNDDSTPGNLVQVAQADGFTALGAAVSKAGLAATLEAPGANLTVFAPTDAAFTDLASKLGFASATAMVDALPADVLGAILTYHVLPARKSAATLAADGATEATAYSFEGAAANLKLATTGGVSITDADLTTAHVTQADVAASNGVIHVIDKVLVPPGVLNVVQMAQANPTFSTLVGAVVSANLQGTLSGAGPFTVFAPTNDAFAAISSTVAGLNNAQLTTVLTYHVLGQQVLAADIPFGMPIATVSGQDITINAGSPPTITDTTSTPAPIVATDVRASNGVIHVVGKVLIPAL